LALIKKPIAKGGSHKICIDMFPKGDAGVKLWEKNMGLLVDLKSVLFFDCSLHTMETRAKAQGMPANTISKKIEEFEKDYKHVLRYYENVGKVSKISTEGGENEVHVHTKKLVEKFIGVPATVTASPQKK